jgi:hypothetical protein
MIKQIFIKKILIKKVFRAKFKAYSLLEMVVTLFLTSMIMLALVSLMSQILQISAITYNRTQTSEDITDFVQSFEKDIRNAATVGECGGEGENFNCEFFSNAVYRWSTCTPRELPAQCTAGESSACDDNGIDYTVCKYRVTSDPTGQDELIFQLNSTYNLDVLRISEVEINSTNSGNNNQNNQNSQDNQDPEDQRRVIALTVSASHPVTKFKIDNIVRQTVITTKNFEQNL